MQATFHENLIKSHNTKQTVCREVRTEMNLQRPYRCQITIIIYKFTNEEIHFKDKQVLPQKNNLMVKHYIKEQQKKESCSKKGKPLR